MPTLVLDQQNRTGTFTTSSVDTPAGGTVSVARVLAVMSDADAADTSHACRSILQATFDGTTWADMQSADWVGGPPRHAGDPPARPGQIFQFDPAFPPKSIRGVFDTRGQTLNFGATIDFSAE